MTLSAYSAALELLVPGEHPLLSGDLSELRAKAVLQAISVVNRHCPRIVVEDLSGSGSRNYSLLSLSAWDSGFSILREVEYPLDTAEQRGPLIAEERWTAIETPAGPILRFFDVLPGATETIRLRYTARHICTPDACSVPGDDEEAVQRLAAANYCLMLSAAYALDQDSTIAADAVNHATRSSNFDKLALRYRQEYNRHFGLVDGKAKPASVTRDQDRQGSWAGDHLTHGRRYR